MDIKQNENNRPGTVTTERTLSSPPLPTPSPVVDEAEVVEPKKYLKKEDILNADDRKVDEVDIPEWGGTVCIKHMTGHERDKWEKSCKRKDGSFEFHNFRSRLASLCIVDQDGKLMFSQEDVSALGKKSSIALDRIFKKVMEINKLSDQDVEDMAKN